LGKIKEAKHQDKGVPNRKHSNNNQVWREWLEIGVYALLLFPVLLIFDTSLKSQFTLPKLLWIQTIFPAIAVVWMIMVWRGVCAVAPTRILWALLVLVGWWILSTCFAIHIPTALHGMTGRYNGLLAHILWAILFVFIATGGKERKRIERFMALIAAALFLVALYAICQPIDPSWREHRVISTIGHPVLLAALLGLALPLVIAFVILVRQKVWKLVLGAAFIIFAIAIALTKSRGPWIGAIVSVLLMLGLIYIRGRIRRKHIVWASIAVLAVLVLGIGVVSYVRPDAYSSFMNRFVFYRAALSMVRDHPISGVGFESFSLLYPKYRPIEPANFDLNVIPTMVHNGYLQAAATTGILGLAFYLALICAVLIPLLRAVCKSEGRRRVIGASLAASIVGYLVQDLAGWMEISLSLFFWIILGLAVSYLSSETPPTRQQSEGSRFNLQQFRRIAPLFGIFAIIFSLWLCYGTFKEFEADKDITLAETGDVSIDWHPMVQHINMAIEGSGQAAYLDRAAVLYINRVEKVGDRAAYDRAHELLDRGRSLNRFDPYLLIHHIQLRIAGLKHEKTKNDPRNYDDIVASTIIMDPNNPTVYEFVAFLRLAEGRINECLQFINQAIRLRPNIASYHALLGRAYECLGNLNPARQEFEITVKLDSNNKSALDGLQRVSALLPK
jgi:O-antigen ligase